MNLVLGLSMESASVSDARKTQAISGKTMIPRSSSGEIAKLPEKIILNSSSTMPGTSVKESR